MAKEFSFDVVSKVDMHAIGDCVQVALKEIGNRYDFRGTKSTIEYDQKAAVLTLQSTDDFKVKALLDVLNMRLAKRELPLKNFVDEKVESALGGTARMLVKITQGIPSDKAKEIVKELKKTKLKVQASIQKDQLRVTAKSKDELQEAISFLKGKDFGLALQFENYR
ncbi:MAG: YajQ family cyclic di-GMP-binding protein [Elusimicrobiota bacterium]